MFLFGVKRVVVWFCLECILFLCFCGLVFLFCWFLWGVIWVLRESFWRNLCERIRFYVKFCRSFGICMMLWLFLLEVCFCLGWCLLSCFLFLLVFGFSSFIIYLVFWRSFLLFSSLRVRKLSSLCVIFNFVLKIIVGGGDCFW